MAMCTKRDCTPRLLCSHSVSGFGACPGIVLGKQVFSVSLRLRIKATSLSGLQVELSTGSTCKVIAGRYFLGQFANCALNPHCTALGLLAIWAFLSKAICDLGSLAAAIFITESD